MNPQAPIAANPGPAKELHLRALFENMNEGYAYCRMLFEGGAPADFIYLEVNKAFERLTGLSNVVGRRVSEVVPGIRQSNPELFQIYGRAAATGNPERFESYVGALGIWFSITVYSPVRGHFVAVFDNITGRKATEEAVRSSEERLRRLVENVSDLITVLNEQGIIRYQSPSVLPTLGLSVAEVTGRNLHDLVAPEDSLAVGRFLQQALADYKGVAHVEFRVRHRDGSWRILQAAGRGLPGIAGERQIVATSRDVTESRLLEEKFRRTQRLEAIGSLASGVAHDLNNILAPMLMAAGLVKDNLPTERDRQILAMVETGAQRAASIVRQLLAFSRGTEGAHVSIEMRHAIRETEALMRETFPRGIAIEQSVAKGLWRVVADATQMQQVLLNLCVNARDAMPEGGKITLSAANVQLDEEQAKRHPDARPGPYVRVSVADTGTGIRREDLQRIFEPFFTTKGEGKGTGLGLSTAAGILRGHGGFLEVASELGRGTTFAFFLPAACALEPAKPEAPKDDIPLGMEELILVVDDEAPILTAVGGVLRRHRYRVIAARSGEEAIRSFVEYADSVALVLTDVMMPGVSGLELARSLRVIRPDVRIVAMSGLDDEDSQGSIAKLGFTDVLSKPWRTEELLKTIGRALGRGAPAA